MTDPQAMAAAVDYFRSRGFQHGDQAATHAATLLAWTSEVWGWAAQMQAERDQARADTAAAHQQVDQVAAVVRRALDAADPDRPGALVAFVRTIAALLEDPGPSTGGNVVTEPRITPAWRDLAGRALAIAVHDDLPAAGRVIDRIAREHGPNIIPNVLLAWIDTMLAHTGGPEPGQLVRLGFINADTGERSTATDVPPHIAWAGQLIAARAAEDRDTFEALIGSVPDDEAWQYRVASVLQSCALHLRAAHAQDGAP